MYTKKRTLPLMNYPDRIELVLAYKYDIEDTEVFTEKVEAIRVGDYYQLVHVPAFAPNIAYGDIVKVDFDDGVFYFDELIEESGYSVAHIVIWKPTLKAHVIATLNEFGCGVNTHIADNYVVVSIPPQLIYGPIRTFLLQQKAMENIEFKDCLSAVHAATI